MSSQTIQQMESARSLALGDGRYYPTIIPGVLPIIGYSEDQSIEIQRWGADFLAEAFASPTWPQEVKQQSAEPEKIEELDLTEQKTPLQEALQKQREDAVKAQAKPEETVTTFNSFNCVICMDTPTDLTATACG